MVTLRKHKQDENLAKLLSNLKERAEEKDKSGDLGAGMFFWNVLATIESLRNMVWELQDKDCEYQVSAYQEAIQNEQHWRHYFNQEKERAAANEKALEKLRADLHLDQGRIPLAIAEAVLRRVQAYASANDNLNKYVDAIEKLRLFIYLHKDTDPAMPPVLPRVAQHPDNTAVHMIDWVDSLRERAEQLDKQNKTLTRKVNRYRRLLEKHNIPMLTPRKAKKSKKPKK